MLSHDNAIKKLNIADLFRLDPIRDLTAVYYAHIKLIIVYLRKYTLKSQPFLLRRNFVKMK